MGRNSMCGRSVCLSDGQCSFPSIENGIGPDECTVGFHPAGGGALPTGKDPLCGHRACDSGGTCFGWEADTPGNTEDECTVNIDAGYDPVCGHRECQTSGLCGWTADTPATPGNPAVTDDQCSYVHFSGNYQDSVCGHRTCDNFGKCYGWAADTPGVTEDLCSEDNEGRDPACGHNACSTFDASCSKWDKDTPGHTDNECDNLSTSGARDPACGYFGCTGTGLCEVIPGITADVCTRIPGTFGQSPACGHYACNPRINSCEFWVPDTPGDEDNDCNPGSGCDLENPIPED